MGDVMPWWATALITILLLGLLVRLIWYGVCAYHRRDKVDIQVGAENPYIIDGHDRSHYFRPFEIVNHKHFMRFNGIAYNGDLTFACWNGDRCTYRGKIPRWLWERDTLIRKEDNQNWPE